MTDELIVMCSGAFATVLDCLLPSFRSDPGLSIRVIRGPSIGASPRALPVRLRAGEVSDLAILFEGAIDALIDEGLILAGTKTRLASSGIGVAVRHGAPQPDVSSPEALRHALLRARSFAYSASASGVYVTGTLMRRLGLPDEVAARGVRADGEPVGAVVARGDAELGFQQMSELLSIQGIAVLGPLPKAVQETNVLSAALLTRVRHASAAHALIAHLVSEEAHPYLAESGLEPAEPARR